MTKSKAIVGKIKAKVAEVVHHKPVVEMVTLPRSEVVELLDYAHALGDWHLPVHGRAMIMGKVAEWRERNVGVVGEIGS